MGLMKELNDLNDIYQKMYVTEVSADLALKASKKAEVERGKAAVAGDKDKAKKKLAQSSRLYAAQKKKRLNSEDYETKKKGEVLGAMKKQGRKLSDKEKNKIADKVVKDKGDTSKSDDRYAYESITPEVEKLIESGKFSAKEIANIADIQEADIADILARLEKKRISKGGNPDDSPLPAMKKYHADKKKKKVKEDYWREDAQSDAVAQMMGDGGDPQEDAIKQIVRAEKKAAKKKKAKK